MSWRDWPRAPAAGTILCPLAAVAPTASLDLDGFPVLLVQGAGGLAGYVNACPHQYLPLDFHGPNVLSEDGARLICSAHQACFDARDGALICGPADDGLEALPLALIDGMVVIGPD
ncbi:(2Fe-2S)-binding protein [Paracoccus suum]|uniref:(2Fe-2S)-binding protein n=1 Tax=Paracoccus suum TaxID=2259340 RepID=A0A344PIJ8_9RHOB|nr:Rieske 2Fe-2S domain-containing protein [Paracoccus suum]AXC49203.1 (2Fe-2S)-binding protein [Paracoccus suum]